MYSQEKNDVKSKFKKRQKQGEQRHGLILKHSTSLFVSLSKL